MASGGGGNDFFLQFGSDAAPFSQQLAADLNPGIERIDALRQALLSYEETAGKIKGGSSPLGITFEGLDQAASRLEAASKQFSGNIEAQLGSLKTQIEGLAEIMSRLRPPQTRPGGAPLPPARPPAGGSERITSRGYDLDPEIQRRLAAIDRAKSTASITSVTPTDQAAANKQRVANDEVTASANKAANANGLSAKEIKATGTALESLTKQLQGLIAVAKEMPAVAPGGTHASVAASAEGALQIGNTTANPIPVIVVGGEAQATSGHPAGGHQTHLPLATTATQTAKAQQEVAAAAEVTNASNSYKNPTRVMPDDRVAQGEYFLLPGQKKPTRAFGIRNDETVGQYSARVDALRDSANEALAGGPTLDAEKAQILKEYKEGHGRLPLTRVRAIDRSTGISQQENVSAYAGYPDHIAKILHERDEAANSRLDMGHSWALKQLRQDPMLTQDGLPDDAKAALSRIDSILANNTRKTVTDQLFEGEDHPDLATLKKGARNRNRLRDQGRAAYAESDAARQAQAAIDGSAGRRDPITGEWVKAPTGMLGVNERRKTEEQARADQEEIQEAASQRDTQGLTAMEGIHNAGTRYRLAGQLTEKISSTSPDDYRRQAKVREDLQRQLTSITDPTRADLNERIRRAERNITRNRSLGRGDLVEKHTRTNQDLQAQLAAITPKDRSQKELLRAASAYESHTADRLVNRVTDEDRPRPESLTSTSSTLESTPEVVAATEETPRRRGRRTSQGEDQAVSAVTEATNEVAQVKAQIHDLNAQLSQRNARLGHTRDGSQNQQKLQAALERLEKQKAELAEEKTRLNRELSNARRREARATGRSNSEQDEPQAASGGGGAKPPVVPPAPPAASEPEPEPTPKVVPTPRPKPPTRQQLRQNVPIPDLIVDPATRQQIVSARAILARGNVSNDARLAAVNRAAAAFHGDDNYRANGTPPQRVRALTQALGLDARDSGTRGLVQKGLQDAAKASQQRAAQSSGASQGAQGENALAAATQRSARMEDILATSSGKVREARLAEFIAEENLLRLRQSSAATTEQVARAEIQLSSAQRNSQGVQAAASAEENKSTYARLTGRSTGTTFGSDLRRHSAYALENTIGYSLVFTGFEKLREVVQTGIEAQAVFVRLQASLNANGIAAGNLQTKLAQISASTATPLEQVTEAAAELSGTLTNASDISFGTKIASQLANISQGALTAQEAAVGLRDVIAAFGDEWANTGMSVQQGLQQTGDQIAHLSQLTGVSVKDITEGTTQIAQEAHEFGLTQRQASTLSAYITKGTGETGEQSASQASRMLATLYNGKTQQVLETTRLYDKNGQPVRNKDGSFQTLATQGQFEKGQIGDILASIASNWGDLTPRERQAISAQMGTGIQARAFAAYVGGGKVAAGEMKGTGNDSGALNNQNKSYLATVAGMIKQLDEDFQNLGSTLQRLGAFDAIGLLAKSMDELLKTFNAVFGHIASFMNSNPITSGLMHWSVIILEAAAAWKVFGSSATRALIGMGAVKRDSLVPVNQREIDAAGGAGAANAPRPIYRFRAVAGAVGGRVGPGLGHGIANRASSVRSYVRDVAVGRNYADLTPLGLSARGAVSVAQTAETKAIEARTKAELEATAAVEKKAAAETAERGAAERLAVAEAEGSVAETELNDLRATQVKASEALIAATDEAAAAQQALAAASTAAATATEESAAAAQRQAEVRSSGFGAGFAGSRLGTVGALGAFLLAGPVGSAISGGESPGQGARGFAGSGAQGLLTGIGIGGMVGGVPGAAVGAVLGAGYGLGKSVLAAKKAEDAQPSAKSDQQFIDLINQIYNNPNGKKAVEGANQRLGYKAPDIGVGQLDKLSTADDIAKWRQQESDYIDKHAGDIAKAGGNNSTAQDVIKKNLDDVKANVAKSAARRIEALSGLSSLDNLNATQLDALQNASGVLGSADYRTLAAQAPAFKTLIEQAGLPTGGQAYQDLQVLAGGANGAAQINTLGINNQGQVGQYSADGQWHPATADQSDPAQRTNLPQLGSGPGTGGNIARLQALQDINRQTITIANAKIQAGGLSDADLQTYRQKLQAATQSYQQTGQQIDQAQIAAPQGRGTALASLGGTPDIAQQMGLGTGGDGEAVSQLSAANAALTKYNSTLETTDPQYWQNLQQIQQNKLQIAQLQAQPDLNRLMIDAAGATDASQAASDKYQIAVKQLQIHQAGGASTAQIGQDQANVAAADVARRQAQEAVTQSTSQAKMSGIENSVAKARAQYADALRLEAVYAQGGSLADQASEQRAIEQANQANIAIKDAVQAQTQAAYDATAAWQKFNGDQMGALYTGLAKANQAYSDAVKRFGASSAQAKTASAQVAQSNTDIRNQLQADALATYDAASALATLQGDAVGAALDSLHKAQLAYQQAITDYGSGSSQAQQALGAVYQAQQQLIQAQVEKINAFLDLDIATLNARGKTGDAESAAQDAVAKVQNQIQGYLSGGGQKGTKAYNDLMGQLATAQRTAFDTGLQAQMDTLDFQQQTYQITSAQEVQSLQLILQNKQLTLQEQRSITLKIKNMQDSIRQQLTQGGLNIPSNITLPSAYDVRRSLGAGFNSAGSSVATVNNNQQVTITNNVPNAAVATQIANQVIQLINQQTSIGLRASSSTPRQVVTK